MTQLGGRVLVPLADETDAARTAESLVNWFHEDDVENPAAGAGNAPAELTGNDPRAPGLEFSTELEFEREFAHWCRVRTERA